MTACSISSIRCVHDSKMRDNLLFIRALIKEVIAQADISSDSINARHTGQRKIEDDDILIDILRHIYRTLRNITLCELKQIAWICYEKIDALKHNKIVRQLGKGAYGITLLLSNDHVLKLYRPDLSEDDWYESMQKAAFSGKGSRHTLMVYDHSVINDTLAYAEISRIVTLNAYLEGLNREPIQVSDEMDSMVEKHFSGARLSQWMQLPTSLVSKMINNIVQRSMSHLTDDECRRLSKAIIAVLKTIDPKIIDEMQVLDLHVGNVGIDQVSGAWIAFDV